MTSASAARGSVVLALVVAVLFVLALVVAVLFVVDVVVGVTWPGRSPEVLRGFVGALSVLAVGALFFASRESGSARDPRALIAVGAGLAGTIALLVGVGLLSAVPQDRAGDLFAYPGIAGPGLLALLVGVVAGASLWRSED